MRRIRINPELFHDDVAGSLASTEQKLWESFRALTTGEDFITDAQGHDSAKGNTNPTLNRDLRAASSAVDSACKEVEAAYAKLVEVQRNQQRKAA